MFLIRYYFVANNNKNRENPLGMCRLKVQRTRTLSLSTNYFRFMSNLRRCRRTRSRSRRRHIIRKLQ